jgi:hypothetical protein
MSTRDRTLAPTRSPCVGNAIARHYQVHGGSTVTPRWFGRRNVAGDVPQITCSCVYGATAGSRQPLSVLRADAVADMRLPSASALCFPRLAHASSWCDSWRVHDVHSAETRMQPRAAGVSPPWFGNAIATAHVFHGWLTPAALGARRPVAAQCGNSAETHMQPRAAGVSPPWFGNAIATSTHSRGSYKWSFYP